jgi:hypothetical protein
MNHLFALKPHNEAHKAVMAVLHKTGQDWKTKGTRKIQFANLGSLILVRTNQQPTGIPCKADAPVFSTGQRLTLQVILPAQKRARDYRTAPAIRTQSEMNDLASALLAENGLSVDSIEGKPAHSAFFKKDGRTTVIAAMHFVATATVTDPQALAIAYTQGVGREKSLGFGMLIVKEV